MGIKKIWISTLDFRLLQFGIKDLENKFFKK